MLLKNSNQSIDLILFLKVEKETILKRLEKRKIIENRSDDDTHTIVSRYERYMETTQPVLNFYSENPNFKEIDGGLEIENWLGCFHVFLIPFNYSIRAVIRSIF